VIERELAIRNFKPTPYWKITAKFAVTKGLYEGMLQKENFKASDERPDDKSDRIWSEADAKALLETIQSQKENWSVTETLKRSEQSSPKLFDLTTLQREMNSRYGFSATTTLRFAQSLYERHKALTYPRTDAQVLPEDYVGTVMSTMGKLEGEIEPFAKKVLANKWIHPNKRIFNNAGVCPPKKPRCTTPSAAGSWLFSTLPRKLITPHGSPRLSAMGMKLRLRPKAKCLSIPVGWK